MPIEIRDLTHTYMAGSPLQATAVHNVRVTIRENDLIGLIGHTGSGKSTLVQHLNGLLKPSSGTISVDGMELWAEKADMRAVRRLVGLVFQYPEYQLFEETVKLDIAFGPKNLGLAPAEVDARVLRAIALVGLDESILDRSPFDLSGGQKRRVAIAGVVAMQPKYLVLDEPAAGLDPRGRSGMLALLKSLHDDAGMTLVMVSHSMNDVAKICNRVLVMNKGTLYLDGTPDEIFTQGDRLAEVGLGLPRPAELAQKLREAGFAIPKEYWRAEDVERAIVAAVKGGDALG